MKTSAKYVISFVVCLLLAVAVVLPVQAKASSNEIVVSSDPVVVGQSGDMTFTATVLAQEDIPGSVVKDQKFLPKGLENLLQFNGKGVEVKGVSYGTENACFNFDLYNYGWTGNVYQWNGSKWSKLATTVKDSGEGVVTACAVIHGNGVYALLDGLTSPTATSFGGGAGPIAPKVEECGAVFAITPFSYDSISGVQVLYKANMIWAANVTRVGVDIGRSDLHLSPTSSGTLFTMGEEYPTSMYPSGKDESFNINNAIIYRGTTVDVHITYKVSGDDTKYSCVILAVPLGENPK